MPVMLSSILESRAALISAAPLAAEAVAAGAASEGAASAAPAAGAAGAAAVLETIAKALPIVKEVFDAGVKIITLLKDQDSARGLQTIVHSLAQLQTSVDELHLKIDRLTVQISDMFAVLTDVINARFDEVLAGIRDLPSRTNHDDWRALLAEIRDNDSRWQQTAGNDSTKEEIGNVAQRLRYVVNRFTETGRFECLYVVATSMAYEAHLNDLMGTLNKERMGPRYDRYYDFFNQCADVLTPASLANRFIAAGKQVDQWNAWKASLAGKKVFSDYDLAHSFGGAVYTLCQVHTIDWTNLDSSWTFGYYNRRGPQPAGGDPASYDSSLEDPTVSTRMLVHDLGVKLKLYRFQVGLRDTLDQMLTSSSEFRDEATKRRANLPSAPPA